MTGTSKIVTWYFEQTSAEGGIYAQVRGDSSTERFRDIYRRCILVFFMSARRHNPDAQLILYLNKAWSSAASAVARDVQIALDQLHVDVRSIPYDFSPPDSWPREWINQFFVFDILKDLADDAKEDDQVLVLDSDIVWSSWPSEQLWLDLTSLGSLTYHPISDFDEDINGLSQREMTALASSASEQASKDVRYCGGEFIALRGDYLKRVSSLSVDLWKTIIDKHCSGDLRSCEEAHLLSIVLGQLSLDNGEGGRYIRRIWTSPLVFSDTSIDDRSLLLWHVPGEKQYGLRRAYKRAIRSGVLERSEVLAKTLGVGKMYPTKVFLDFSYALYLRVVARIERSVLVR